MSNKSKQKGKRGETSICKMLEKTFGLSFIRVFTSGSFFGGKNSVRFDKYDKNQQNLNEGDIVMPEELSHISIECKNYKEFQFHQLFTGKCVLLDKWIEQSSHTNKENWLLFFKITRKNTFVCYDLKNSFKKSDNYFLYKNEYIIQEAKSFLLDNKNIMLKLNQ
jgi:hypothetical protein